MMTKQKEKRSQTMRFAVLAAAVFLAFQILMTGCGSKKGSDDANNSKQEQTQQTKDTKQTNDSQQTQQDDDIAELVGTPSDYSKEENWLSLPKAERKVDTFYLYPTCYLDDSKTAKIICDIDNEQVKERAQTIYENQATVFEESTNVFAPYYRQSNIYHVAGMNNDELEAFQNNEQRTDVYAALDYYFEHYNQGRPFILAGHSQGSIMTKIVLGEYMKAHPEYYKRMVAAYVIGYSITSDWLKEHPYLKFAENASDTGVIVSWNTEGPENKDQKNIVVEDGAISINPINWKLDDTYASSDENLGSRIFNEKTGSYEIKQGLADAQLNTGRGVVVCNTEKENYTASVELFGTASLHNNDYAFYYENLRENVKTRVERFLENKKD